MIDRGLKVVLAVVVLLGGTAGALLFRRGPEEPGRQPPATTPLVLRERGAANPADDPSPAMPTVHIESSQAAAQLPEASSGRRPPTVLAPLDPGAPPPIMARSYPGSPAATTSRWGTSMALGPSDAADPEMGMRTHKITDGDTLENLAERYLGSADRYLEIYEANRYLLPGPDVLPIGVELRIPPRSKPEAGSGDSPPRGPLVPVRPNLLRRPRRP